MQPGCDFNSSTSCAGLYCLYYLYCTVHVQALKPWLSKCQADNSCDLTLFECLQEKGGMWRGGWCGEEDGVERELGVDTTVYATVLPICIG